MSKKKLIITITSLCLVIVAAVAAVVGVVAASTQTVTSAITVTYQATNVRASAFYATRLQGTTYGDDAGTVTFAATSQQTSQSITVPSIALGNSSTSGWQFERYAIIRFGFTNQYQSGQGRSMTVSASTEINNFNTSGNYAVAYASGADEPTAPTMPAGDTALQNSWLTGVAGWSTTVPTNVSVAQAGTNYIYVLVAMINPLVDTNFTSQGISFTLSSVVA